MLDDHLPTDEDRRMLRDSVRNFLLSHWPQQRAVQRGAELGEVREISGQLAAQGLAENPGDQQRRNE